MASWHNECRLGTKSQDCRATHLSVDASVGVRCGLARIGFSHSNSALHALHECGRARTKARREGGCVNGSCACNAERVAAACTVLLLRSVRLFSQAHHSAPRHTKTHQDTPGHTKTPQDTPRHTTTHHNPPKPLQNRSSPMSLCKDCCKESHDASPFGRHHIQTPPGSDAGADSLEEVWEASLHDYDVKWRYHESMAQDASAFLTNMSRPREAKSI
eukprot:scaffold4635_cov267-Pinguiococcus_pyrenoidosus.AAC.8